jgi:hypothetical protein
MSRSTIPSKKDILRVHRQNGYPIFSGRDFDITLGGIRTNIGGPTGQSRQTDLFDDYIWMRWEEHGQEQFMIVPATTDPGKYYLSRPTNNDGTAILVPGFHKHLWEKGRHSKINNAFRQKSPCTVWRDADRDHYLDMGPKIPRRTGMFWINLHPATYMVGGRSTSIGRWAAGCQVTQTWDDFAALRTVRDMQEKKLGTSVTSYALTTIADY